MLNLFNYLPQEYFSHRRADIKYLLRKRIFHSGWELLCCYIPASVDQWILIEYTKTRADAVDIIKSQNIEF